MTYGNPGHYSREREAHLNLKTQSCGVYNGCSEPETSRNPERIFLIHCELAIVT